MTFEFHIEIESHIPIYRQIEDQVRKAVAIGVLKMGESLPSIRSLAKKIKVNSNTVARAYNELVKEGLLQSSPGKSLTIAKKSQVFTREEQEKRLNAAVNSFISEILILDFSSEEIHKILEDKLLEAGKGPSKHGVGEPA
jgi:GntR family transcriptional regulator